MNKTKSVAQQNHTEIIIIIIINFIRRKIDSRENKKLSYCWETVRRESMPRIAEMDVEMTS